MNKYVEENKSRLAAALVVMLGAVLGLFDTVSAALGIALVGAIQLSNIVRSARLDAIETTIGLTPLLEFWSGALPANCDTADAGVLLGQQALPSDWLANAALGVKAKAGTWTVTGLAAGTIGHFRICDTGSPNHCHLQGTVTATGGGGDMTVDNTNIAVNQVVTVNTFQLTDANA